MTIACELIERIRDSGAFVGMHLIPVNRYREIAARLETLSTQGRRIGAVREGIPAVPADPSMRRTPTQDAELVSFWIGENNPRPITLSNVDP